MLVAAARTYWNLRTEDFFLRQLFHAVDRLVFAFSLAFYFLPTILVELVSLLGGRNVIS